MYVPNYTLEEAAAMLELDKAAGPPFSYRYGPTKGDVLKHMTPSELLHHWDTYEQYSDCTLKDEVRLRQKDARLFVPANVANVLVGNHLFAAQNEAIAFQHMWLPIQIGLSTPGYEMQRTWIKLRNHPGKKNQYDGSQHDSHFSVAISNIIREWRKRYLPEEFHSRVDRYYSMIYQGCINVGGYLVPLPGQLSGHTNTAVDNSLLTLIGLMIHAIRNNMPYEEFTRNIYLVMGDDLVVSDISNKFTPESLGATWNSFGMYLECPSLDAEDFYSLTFMGCSPGDYVHRMFQRVFLLYKYKYEKLSAALNYRMKKASVADRLDRYVGIIQLLFCDEHFPELRDIVCRWASSVSTFLDARCREVSYHLSEAYLFKLYTSAESCVTTGSFFQWLYGPKVKRPLK